MGRGVLDAPPEPVIGLAEGETRWRGMTVVVVVAAPAYTASQLKALPLRRIFPTVGEGKCAVQHNVSLSQ